MWLSMNQRVATPVKAWVRFAKHASPAGSRRQLRFMVPMRARRVWRLSMNRSSSDRADIREGPGKLRQVLDCGDGVCAIAALAPCAKRTSPNPSQSGDSLRSSPQSKTLARRSPRHAGSWAVSWSERNKKLSMNLGVAASRQSAAACRFLWEHSFLLPVA